MMLALTVHLPPEPMPVAEPEARPADPRPDHEPQDVLPLVMTNSERGQYRRRLLARGAHCLYCGKALNLESGTMDHVVPKSRGGANNPWNLWLSCAACNQQKSGRTPLEWAEALQAEADKIWAACERLGLLND
jgi:5-methylcytosine-specific restriction endonuclease McrA